MTVKILAKVKKQELTKRISGVMPAKTVAIGDSLARLHAQSVTKESKASDGAALLRKELENFDPYRQFFEVSLASAECVPVEAASSFGRPLAPRRRQAAARDEESTVQVDYLFKLEVNSDKFFQEFVPHMDRVLSQIALSEPIVLRGEARACDGLVSRSSGYFSDYEAYVNPSNRAKSPHDYGCIGKCFSFNFSSWGDMHAVANRIGDGARENLHVALVTKANAALTLIKGKGYELDPACAAEYDRWAWGKRELPKYAVSFLDADGEELAEQVVDFRNPHQVPCECLRSGAGQNCTGKIWLITPWIGCRSKVYYQWFRFKLEKDDLPKIKSIKVALAD